ncbi:MAG: putative ABC transporter permease subunit [Thermoguttaceae bacterium]
MNGSATSLAGASGFPAGWAAAGGLAVWPLASPHQEARAFWRMRWRLMRTLVLQAFCRAWFRLSMIGVLSLILWGGLFWLFCDAFQFLKTAIPSPDLHDETVQIIFGTFFVTLMVMLVFSAAIILYGSLFRARDTAFLLTLPIRPERVFLTKFQDAVVMSSWAFLLLASPMLVAYGLVGEAPWYYFAMLLPFLIAFSYVPAAIGALACLAVVRWAPRGRWYLLGGLGLVAAGVGLWGLWSMATAPESDLLTPGWFQDVLERLRITEHRLLPSWWLSAGLFQTAQRKLDESVMFLALMISNALFFRQLAIWTASGIYRSAYSRLASRPTGRKRTRTAWIDRAAAGLTGFLSPHVRLLIVKDLRLFRRDPVQWSQLLIFIGLLTFYFLNVRKFNYDTYYGNWVNLVSFLNVSVVGLLLSTFTTRFIFPMISLEGRRFWCLGLLPIRRATILWSKFAFAVGASILPSGLLIFLSDVMLQVHPLIMASHQLTCLILCLGLSGIAVGLGARIPNLREQSPARIAAGFGGTLNLVLSTLYILAVVLLTAVPSHFYLGGSAPRVALQLVTSVPAFEAWVRFWLIAGTAASLLLGVVATVVPMWIGLRAFRRVEF